MTTDPEITCNSPCTIADIDASVAKTVSYRVSSKGSWDFGLDDFISGIRSIQIMPIFDASSPVLTSVTPLATTQSAIAGTADIGFEIPEFESIYNAPIVSKEIMDSTCTLVYDSAII